jgi:rod shape-determining protein MreD
MIDQLIVRLWMFRFLFLATACLILFIKILPIDFAAGRWPAPDFLVALAFAWVLRRDEYVPTLLIALIALATDFLFQRPPGLWAAITVVGLEFLRNRKQLNRELPFLFEWGMVSAVVVVMALVNRVFLAIFVVDLPALGLMSIGVVGTILCYPLVVLTSHYIFGVRKIAPGEVDQLGHRI